MNARRTGTALTLLLSLAACGGGSSDDQLLGTSLTAEFSATPVIGAAPLTVNFSDHSTGSPFTWFWTFGDGGSSNLPAPVHTYTEPGTYSVRLRVSACGLIGGCADDTEMKTGLITVTAPLVESPPPARALVYPGSSLPTGSTPPHAALTRGAGSARVIRANGQGPGPGGGRILSPAFPVPPGCERLELVASCNADGPHACSLVGLEAAVLAARPISATRRTVYFAPMETAGSCTAAARFEFELSGKSRPDIPASVRLAVGMAPEYDPAAHGHPADEPFELELIAQVEGAPLIVMTGTWCEPASLPCAAVR